jgi:hypothetical protein
MVCVFFAMSKVAFANSDGLKTYVAVDLVGEAFERSKEVSPREVELRGVEVSFSAPVDPLFDAVVGLAAHSEDGVSIFELHEATLSSSKLLPHTLFRLGQGFLSIGKLNRVHQHDWPFIDTPEVQEKFFDKEGVNDVLFEGTVNTPTSIPFELTMGIAKGWNYGHAHSSGERPLVPTHYARAQTFTALPGEGGLQIALNYLARTSSDKNRMQLSGLDLTAKWREGRTLRFFLQSEIWMRNQKALGVPREDAVGFYLFPQANLLSEIDFGVRIDGLQFLNIKDALGREVSKSSNKIVPTLTYKPSEFSTFRLAYAWDLEKRGDHSPEVKSSRLIAQLTFVIGAHPSHEF